MTYKRFQSRLKFMTKENVKVLAAFIFFEGLLVALGYHLTNDLLVGFLLVGSIQVIMFLIALPLGLISIIWSFWKHGEFLNAVMIWIWQGKAYLPTLAETDTLGIFADVEPVHIVDLTHSSLTEAMKRVKEAGHQHEVPSAEKGDPLLAVTKAQSSEILNEESAIFIVIWTSKFVELGLVEVKKDSRRSLKSFPPDVSLETVSKAILAAIKI